MLRFVVDPGGVERFVLTSTLTGFDTSGLDPVEEITYYLRLRLDERPAAVPGPDTADARAVFALVDPDAIDDHPTDEGPDRVTVEPTTEPTVDGRDGGGSGGDTGTDESRTGGDDAGTVGTATVESVPGFGVLGTLAALGSVGALWVRRQTQGR